jgi:diguanylate cyclase (GGDEF)-like protein
MLRYALIFAVVLAFSICAFLGIYAQFFGKSEKKNYFILAMLAACVLIVGHLLEITSKSTDEAFTAIRVLYIGSTFTMIFTFFFVADYCDFKIHPWFVRFPMIVLTLAIITAMWTTQSHHLVYESYAMDELGMYLDFVPGSLYHVFHYYPLAVMLASLVVIFRRIPQTKGRYRTTLILLIVAVLIPFAAEGLYFIEVVFGTGAIKVYFTPYSLAIMGIVLYAGVVRFDMFDIIPMAAVQILESISEAYILIDNQLNFLTANPVAKRLFPELSSVVKGEHITNVAGWPSQFAAIGDNRDNKVVEFSIESDATKYYRASASCVGIGAGDSYAWAIVIQDVTDSVNLVNRLEAAAYIDVLTGIYNRRHFAELAAPFIEKAIRQSNPYYIMMLDIDFFKTVNDTYGHLAGDEVLKMTAAKIKKTIRSYDLFARYGGEEFIILLTDPSEKDVIALADRIRVGVSEMNCEYGGNTIRVTCSLGIAKNYDDCSLDDLIDRSDRAMYRAKGTGRDRVCMWTQDS